MQIYQTDSKAFWRKNYVGNSNIWGATHFYIFLHLSTYNLVTNYFISPTSHNELKRGKNSNFKCLFGWLQDYLRQRCLKKITLPPDLLREHSIKKNSTNVDFSLWCKKYSVLSCQNILFSAFWLTLQQHKKSSKCKRN